MVQYMCKGELKLESRFSDTVSKQDSKVRQGKAQGEVTTGAPRESTATTFFASLIRYPRPIAKRRGKWVAIFAHGVAMVRAVNLVQRDLTDPSPSRWVVWF
jgi:hypothetical protein